MPSTPRYYILEDYSLFHVTWKCHNNDWLLKEDWAKQLYYNLLVKYKDRYGVQIYAYCFMDNHPHLTGKLKSVKDFSDFFRVVNSYFARFYKKTILQDGGTYFYEGLKSRTFGFLCSKNDDHFSLTLDMFLTEKHYGERPKIVCFGYD